MAKPSSRANQTARAGRSGGGVKLDEAFFASVFDNDPLDEIPADDLDKLIEAEEGASLKQGRPFDWGDVYGDHLKRYLSDKPDLRTAYAAYAKRIEERYPQVAKWYKKESNASTLRRCLRGTNAAGGAALGTAHHQA